MVLLEAMASKKPVIASDVDGIPRYVKDGYNGLLFQSGDVESLVDKIKIILQDENFAIKIADNGYNYVFENLSESMYLKQFVAMIEKVTTKQI